jgi:hypothetical protein
MRTFALTLVVALATGTLDVAPAAAFTGPDPAGIRSALASTNPVESVACWGYGWRGWGLYPGWFCGPIYAAPAYVAPPAYGAPYYPPTAVDGPPAQCWIDGRWRRC